LSIVPPVAATEGGGDRDCHRGDDAGGEQELEVAHWWISFGSLGTIRSVSILRT
jgi:hypothetical protein